MKTPIVITTLEEDFKKIGLIKANLVESVQAEELDEADEELEEEADEAGLDEGTRIKRRVQRKKGGGFKVIKTKKQSAHKKSVNRHYRQTHQADIAKAARLAGRGKKLKQSEKAAAFALKKGTHRIPRKTKKAMKRGLNTSVDYAELMKSLANAAIIAENLQTIFTEWYEADLFDAEADEVLVDFVEQLEAIAEDFADAATALHEGVDGEEIDDDIVEMFKEGLDIVLDAVDLYEGTKEEASDDEGMCEECDDEECEGCEGND
jgi:hypothetical protein